MAAFKTDKITTPVFRVSYCYLLKPSQNEDGKWAYRVTMIFEPDADLSGLARIAKQAKDEKWGNTPPLNLRTPFRRGETQTEQNPRGYDLDKNPEYRDKIIVSAMAGCSVVDEPDKWDASKQPGLVDANNQLIINPTDKDIYSGMYARATLVAFAYAPKKGTPGIGFGLQNFQKCYDGERIGGSRGNAENDFQPFIAPAGVGNHDDLLAI